MKILIVFLMIANYTFSQKDYVYSVLDKIAEISNENYFLWHQTFNCYRVKWAKHDIRFESDSIKMSCIVEKNGQLSDCNVVYSTNENLTKLVLIVNYKYIYWSPAEKDDKPVRSRQEIKLMIPENR